MKFKRFMVIASIMMSGSAYGICPPQNLKVDGLGGSTNTPCTAPTGVLQRFYNYSSGTNGFANALTPGAFSNSGNWPTIVTNPSFASGKWMRAYVNQSSATNYRTEVVESGYPVNDSFPDGRNYEMFGEYWMGWSLHIPSNYVFSRGWRIFGQMHGPNLTELASSNPPFAIELASEGTTNARKWRIFVRSIPNADGSGKQQWEYYVNPMAVAGTTYHFVVNFRQDYRTEAQGTTGFVKLYINGNLVVNHTRGFGYNSTASGDGVGGYMKWGIYRNRTSYLEDPVEVFYGPIRISKKNAGSFNLVNPQQ